MITIKLKFLTPFLQPWLATLVIVIVSYIATPLCIISLHCIYTFHFNLTHIFLWVLCVVLLIYTFFSFLFLYFSSSSPSSHFTHSLAHSNSVVHFVYVRKRSECDAMCRHRLVKNIKRNATGNSNKIIKVISPNENTSQAHSHNYGSDAVKLNYIAFDGKPNKSLTIYCIIPTTATAAAKYLGSGLVF